MKLIQVFLISFILVKKLNCKGLTNNSSDVANYKQLQLINGSMDLNANPCEDFYQYACGEWENFYEPADDEYYDTLGLLDYKVNKEMAGVFSDMNAQKEPAFVKKAYQYFKSCDDLEVYETSHYLKWITEQENLKFPILAGSLKSAEDFDWLRTLAVMRIYGLNGIFIEENVMQRGDDPSKFIIYFDKPLAEEGFTALSLDDLKQILEYLKETLNSTIVLELWNKVQAFEFDLKELNDIEDEVESEEDDGIDWSLKNVDDLPLPWLKDYLKILLNKTELDPNMEIFLQNIPYFKALNDLVKQHSQRFLCEYLEIRFLYHLDKQGPLQLTAEDCVSNVRSFLPLAMHWLYENQHPDLRLEFANIIELFEDIRKHFNTTIQQNNYGFNETVVDFLLAKINNMQLKLNNIPRINTIQTLENFYDNLDLNDDDNFYANHLKLIKFNFIVIHNLLSNTTKQIDVFLEDLEFAGASSSPYYTRRSNAVVVPLTILQEPIYQPDSDDVYKYSSLGFLLAREIMYGFDNDGLGFDHKGLVASQLYDDIFANPLFNASFSCLLESNSSIIEFKIADISGLRYAYKIFNDSRTDGMYVSSSRVFFLNFAQYFCGTSYSNESVTYTAHAFDRERLMDVLTHFPEFSRVFLCDSSNRMYPHKECYLWRK